MARPERFELPTLRFEGLDDTPDSPQDAHTSCPIKHLARTDQRFLV